MITKPVLVVLAAGIGNRYGGLKQMDPVGPNNQCLIDYSVYNAKQAGFESVVFIIKDEINADFRNIIGDRIARNMNVEYAYQELHDIPKYRVPEGRVKPWGTVHALLAARYNITGPFAVINADDYYGPEAFKQMYNFLSTNEDYTQYCMIGYKLRKTLTDNGAVTRGVCVVDENNYLTNITECIGIEAYKQDGLYRPDNSKPVIIPGNKLVSMNFWGFQRSFIDEALDRFPRYMDLIMNVNPLGGECYIPLLVDDLIDLDVAKIKVLHTNDDWIGVTYKKDKPFVEARIREMISDGLYPEKLWK